MLYINACRTLCACTFWVFSHVPRSMRTPASAALARPIRTEPRPKSTPPISLSRGDSYAAARSASARTLHSRSRRPRKPTKGGKLGGNFVRKRECKAQYVFEFHYMPHSLRAGKISPKLQPRLSFCATASRPCKLLPAFNSRDRVGTLARRVHSNSASDPEKGSLFWCPGRCSTPRTVS